MRVLVTGGAGFIGSHTADLLIEENYDTVIADNLSTGRKENINPKAKFYKSNITNFRALKKVFGRERIDSVIHLAAQINVRNSLADPFFDAKTNILGSLNVLECCRKFKIKKIVYSSSGGAVYGEPKRIPVKENHPIKPLSPYAVSKYCVEQYLQEYHHNYGLEFAVLRYGNVFGPRQDPRGEAGVTAIFIERMLANERPKIFGSGEQTRDFVFVKDVAKANLLALQKKTKSRTYNIGTRKEKSVNEIFRELKKMLKFKGNAVKEKSVPGEIKRIALDCSLAKKELRWKPETPFKKGLKETIEWHRKKNY
ncbi:MAG: NAD-dependent epimerase/dehydratase family protein [Candidatus Diapherotrites archaeon]